MMIYLDKSNTDQVFAYLNFERSNVVVSTSHCMIGKENLKIKFKNQKTGNKYKLFN